MDEPTEAVPGISKELQAKVRAFFEIYDPARLESSDFNVLLRYIANRGLAALEDKLMKKYGVNIASMNEQEKLEDVPNVENEETRKAFSKRSETAAELSELPMPPGADLLALNPTNTGENDVYQTVNQFGTDAPNNLTRPVSQGLDRAAVFHRLTEFYRVHNKEKLKQGIGSIVEFAMQYGMDKVNIKLKTTYGEDLDTFEKNIRTSKRKSQLYEAKHMLLEEANVSKMDPEDQKLRKDLIDFFLIVEPARAELKMDVLLNYAKKHGIGKLNEKMYKKYGYDLMNYPPKEKPPENEPRIAQFGTVKPAQIEQPLVKNAKLDEELTTLKKGQLPEYVRVMLSKYYIKFDHMMLEDGGVDRVYDWTVRNGMSKLNKKLKQRYGVSFQEFVQEANELRDDLIEFYRHRDKNKLVTGIQQILDWGLVNGRKALNEKLRSKYGVDLDVSKDIYDDVMESASQF